MATKKDNKIKEIYVEYGELRTTGNYNNQSFKVGLNFEVNPEKNISSQINENMEKVITKVKRLHGDMGKYQIEIKKIIDDDELPF